MEYRVIYSARKTLAIQISEEGDVVVRAPYGFPKRKMELFLLEKQEWIQRKSNEMKERRGTVRKLTFSEEERQAYARKAGETIAVRAAYFAQKMGVSYGKITIREQKTRWGSCSCKGNLNFNWKLILMPREVLDYVVVHELAHRKEMNHSRAFYQVVESIMPDYKIWQNWLREHEGQYRT